jgi:hypothetical protein
MVREQVFFDKLFNLGRFPDGRLKQDVWFKDNAGNTYVWTPKWKDVIALYTSARRVESTNAPDSQWMRELEEVAREAWGEKVESFEVFEGSIDRLERSTLWLDLSSDYTSIPFRVNPSLAWLKAHYRDCVTVYVVNDMIWEIDDDQGNVIYPEG